MNRKILTLAVLLVAPWTMGCPQAEQAPPPPELGEQIDRMGRPGVTTALLDPINLNDEKDQLQNEYNSIADPERWLFTNPNDLQETRWRSRFRSSLALFDSLDGVCGNQLFYFGDGMDPSSYDGLAICLTYDVVFLNSGNGNCGNDAVGLLAVERNALGFPRNFDCGGRPPTLDVIDQTYTSLVRGGESDEAGNPTAATYSDGVGPDAVPASLTEFPFLAPPQ
jgi:hypothetical protein